MADGRCPSCGRMFADAGPHESPDVVQAIAQSNARSRAAGKAAERDLVIGGAFLAVGIVVTAVTYYGATGPAGGTYLVCWGPVLYGSFRFLRGLARRS